MFLSFVFMFRESSGSVLLFRCLTFDFFLSSVHFFLFKEGHEKYDRLLVS